MEEQSKNKEVFAQGICFNKLFIIFIIGCLFGVFYEEILLNIIDYFKTGEFNYVPRRGLIYGPFSPVYGAGAVVMCLFANKKRSFWKSFLYMSLAGGLVEYVISFLQETFTGTLSWDYSGYFLNIGGRTTIPFMLVWGLCGIILIYIIYPFISNLIEKIPIKIGKIIMPILITVMGLDMLISFSAIIRQTLRRNNVPAYTFIDKFYDKYYSDARLKKVYNNMTVVD